MKKKKKNFKLIFILELVLILILVPGVWIFYQLDRIKTPVEKLDKTEMNDFKDDNINNYKNIALFGVDSRANDLRKNTRSDSIMIASINKKTKKVKLLSVYRDTFVKIDGHGYTKINHAYAYGGPQLAINTMNKNFDLNITDFVTVNFSALSNMVDALGGITLDITSKEELKQVNAYTRDVARINHKKVKYLKSTGKQTVNGTQATAYCRVRYTAGGDFKRAERQRIVFGQIIEKAKKAGPFTLLKLADKIIPQIYTSLSKSELLMLGKDVFFYKFGENTGFPFEKQPKTVGGVSYVFALPDMAKNVTKMHKYLFDTGGYTLSKTAAAYSNGGIR